MNNQICQFCQNPFPVEEDDQTFYNKIEVPWPKLCPNDRQRRRAAFRNERNLYRRTCDATKKEIISMYSPDKPFKVYDQEYWWSDDWNPLEYGKIFDFSKPFFEQFRNLQLSVPRLSLLNFQSENSYYTNHSEKNKNCYMGVDLGRCEDVYFSNWVTDCKDCIDCSYTYKSELCYQCLYCKNCFNCDFCQKCEQCSDVNFCFDCHGCKNCLLCAGLRNQEYCYLNKKISKGEYEKIRNQYAYSWEKQQEALKKWQTIKNSIPHRFAHIINSENCTGDYIYSSKNCQKCFDIVNCWDCKYAYNTLDVKDGYDCYQPGFENSELIYEIHGGFGSYHSKFLHISTNLSQAQYCDQCFSSEHLFGCIGLRHKKYCILNKQYSKEEYENLLPQIIKYMKETGEYGEFFPFWCSPFGYNESKANEYYPITQKEAKQKGMNWCDCISLSPEGTISIPPDDIRETDNMILKKVFLCKESKKPFKIIQQEWDFYKRKKLPIPHEHHDTRYKKRMALRNPRTLWQRHCAQCEKNIQTTYSSDLPEIVYCENCYLKSMY